MIEQVAYQEHRADAVGPHDGTVMRSCGCGTSLAGLPPQTRYCGDCRVLVSRENHRRYDASRKGQARTLRYVRSPKKKLAQAAYEMAHRARVAAYRARANRARRHPTIRSCQAYGCTGIFVLAGHNNATKFCDPCRAFYGRVAA